VASSLSTTRVPLDTEGGGLDECQILRTLRARQYFWVSKTLDQKECLADWSLMTCCYARLTLGGAPFRSWKHWSSAENSEKVLLRGTLWTSHRKRTKIIIIINEVQLDSSSWVHCALLKSLIQVFRKLISKKKKQIWKLLNLLWRRMHILDSSLQWYILRMFRKDLIPVRLSII
jgi:hypothetical protein